MFGTPTVQAVKASGASLGKQRPQDGGCKETVWWAPEEAGLANATDGVAAAMRMTSRMMEMMLMMVMMMTKHCLHLSHPRKVYPRVPAVTKNHLAVLRQP